MTGPDRPGRRVILVGLALGTLIPALAWAAGPRFGLEVAGVDGGLTRRAPAPSTLDDPPMRIAWAAGPTVDWRLGDRWSLGTGLRYVRINEDEDLTITTTSGTSPAVVMRGNARMDWNWIGVPLRASYRPVGPLILEAGPEVRYLLSAGFRSSVDGGTPSPAAAQKGITPAPSANIFEQAGTLGSSRDVTDQYERLDVALTAGAGVEWPLAGHLAAVRGRYVHGLPDLARGSLERRTREFELALGWSW